MAGGQTIQGWDLLHAKVKAGTTCKQPKFWKEGCPKQKCHCSTMVFMTGKWKEDFIIGKVVAYVLGRRAELAMTCCNKSLQQHVDAILFLSYANLLRAKKAQHIAKLRRKYKNTWSGWCKHAYSNEIETTIWNTKDIMKNQWVTKIYGAFVRYRNIHTIW